MVKCTQAIRRQQSRNCFIVFDDFLRLAFKRLKIIPENIIPNIPYLMFTYEWKKNFSHFFFLLSKLVLFSSHSYCQQLYLCFLTLKRLGRVKLWFFVKFNMIIIHIFPENFVEFSQVVHKIWRFPPLVLTILIFRIFWHYLVANKLMTPRYNRWCHHFFYFKPTYSK